MFSREKITQHLTNYESEYDVEHYILEDLKIWPVIKLRVAFDLFFSYDKKPWSTFKNPSLMSKRRVISSAKRLLGLSKSLSQEKLFQGTDIVCVTDANRKIRVHGRDYNYIIDPFCELAKSVGLQSMIWEHGKILPSREKMVFPIGKRLKNLIDKRTSIAYLNRKEPQPPWFADLSCWLHKHLHYDMKWHYLSYKLKQIILFRNYIKKLLREMKCRMVLIDCWYIPPNLAIIQAAKTLGIATIDFQHGAQGPGHFGYCGWLKENGCKDFMPDYFWVWGDYSAHNLLENNPILSRKNIIVGGNLWINKWRGGYFADNYPEYSSLQDMRKNYDKIILVTLQYNINDNESIIHAMNNSPSDWYWFIRLHRQMLDKRPEIKKYFKKHTQFQNYNIDSATDAPLYFLYTISTVHVTWFSTCALEALAFGVGSVIINETGRRLFSNLIEKGIMDYASSPEMIRETIIKTAEKDTHLLFEEGNHLFQSIEKANKAIHWCEDVIRAPNSR
ncbi:MAG: hypothetical protein ACMUJM_06320 [bacterium]